jgi:hypothetical protein
MPPLADQPSPPGDGYACEQQSLGRIRFDNNSVTLAEGRPYALWPIVASVLTAATAAGWLATAGPSAPPPTLTLVGWVVFATTTTILATGRLAPDRRAKADGGVPRTDLQAIPTPVVTVSLAHTHPEGLGG